MFDLIDCFHWDENDDDYDGLHGEDYEDLSDGANDVAGAVEDEQNDYYYYWHVEVIIYNFDFLKI